MNKTVRLLVLVLVFCAVTFSCGKENPLLNMDLDDTTTLPEDNDTLPDIPEPREQGTCTVIWDGLPVSIGHFTLTQDSQQEHLLVVEAVHSLADGVATLPRFIIRLWYDDDHGLLVAGEYLFVRPDGTSTPGQELFPTEAYIASSLPDGNGGQTGDYQWAWTNSENYSTYDPATLTASLNVAMTFVDEALFRQLVELEGAPADQADYEQMVRRSKPKVMRLQLVNCRFTPPSTSPMSPYINFPTYTQTHEK